MTMLLWLSSTTAAFVRSLAWNAAVIRFLSDDDLSTFQAIRASHAIKYTATSELSPLAVSLLPEPIVPEATNAVTVNIRCRSAVSNVVPNEALTTFAQLI